MFSIILHPQTEGQGAEMVDGCGEDDDACQRQKVVDRSAHDFDRRRQRSEQLLQMQTAGLAMFLPVQQRTAGLGKGILPLPFPLDLGGGRNGALFLKIKVPPTHSPFGVQGGTLYSSPGTAEKSNDSCSD